jgi:BirA family biotin operon repressor/biotin-[acetyl-CoA-carboxylase] ligase
MVLRPDGIAPARWPHLPLLTGVGVARALSRVAEIDVSLKWPNDVMADDRKLGGILAERVETEAGPAAVVGVGLNVSLRETELPVPTAISLALAGSSCVDRDTVLRAVLRGIAAEYDEWVAAIGAPHAFLSAYRELCATIGRRVRVELPGGTAVEGLATGVDDDGSLIVRTATGARAVTAGDVVHVR